MWAYRKSYGFLELILSELLNVLYFFATFYLHFFLFLGQMGRAGQKNKRIIKTYVFAMFSEILGSCPAHSFFYFFKKNQKNVKLTAAHQYWGAPQCMGSRPIPRVNLGLMGLRLRPSLFFGVFWVETDTFIYSLMEPRPALRLWIWNYTF